MIDDTISAIATPAGLGGVAVIRLSGVDALKIAAKIFKPLKKIDVESFIPNYMYVGNIICDGFSDLGMCVYFKAPKSFTGEDVVELHCHGGTQIARGVLKATVSAGARLAERGEFTKRAFVGGKLSLSSCEGMIDMINAESVSEVRAGNLLYREALTQKVEEIQSKLKDILAQIAADIDYPEEGIEETELSNVEVDLEKILSEINALAGQYVGGKLIKSGVSVAICGAPNVGKSSLLNALLGYDKAIVSPIAGTTRDAVEGTLIIGDVKFNFIDTAGIREQAGEIEGMGIDRARRAQRTADIVLCVSDCADFSAADIEAERVIKVFSKTDEAKPFGDYDIAVSSVNGDGLEKLKQLLLSRVSGKASLDSAFVIEERHFAALNRAADRLKEAVSRLDDPLDLISLDLRECWRILGEITGETADEEIIDTVFSKFCVGK
ncbi:MAG: tRNA uridine-5-carboxymethylaminomethyl(34) synthesis GTPase MnmE [Clostridia bacterium]|nr:tRNA uridine-5-carboxymethylaminomethyl(34) synthesis GTPase MnmE [Clostridia bacterium]